MRFLHATLLIALMCAACDDPHKTSSREDGTNTATPNIGPASGHTELGTRIDSVASHQVSQYIRCVFQDRDGNMWFGTTSDGVARYGDQGLSYFNARNGLGSDWVSGMVQDLQGDIWFGTRDGISRYDGERFTRYTTKDGLAHDQVYCVLLDRKGWLWAATENGVSCFDGKKFHPFPLPVADLSKHPYYEGPKRINWMIEDKAGNIWFASNGGGAYRYDGKRLTNLSTRDGLCDDFVQTMLQDRNGDLWFGTRHGGVCRYDGQSFTSYGREQLNGDDVSALYQNRNGTIWIGVTRVGLCSYDGRTFTRYSEKDGAGIRVIFCALEDSHGQLWFGTGAGVYRLESGAFVNWTKGDATGSIAH